MADTFIQVKLNAVKGEKKGTVSGISLLLNKLGAGRASDVKATSKANAQDAWIVFFEVQRAERKVGAPPPDAPEHLGMGMPFAHVEGKIWLESEQPKFQVVKLTY